MSLSIETLEFGLTVFLIEIETLKENKHGDMCWLLGYVNSGVLEAKKQSGQTPQQEIEQRRTERLLGGNEWVVVWVVYLEFRFEGVGTVEGVGNFEGK